MDSDDQAKKTNKAGGGPAKGAPPGPTSAGGEAETSQPVDPEEAKRQARRKLKPVGPIMKPLSDEEIKKLLYDPEDKERENLLDAMPKGQDYDDQDGF